MLEEIYISNFILIDEVRMDFVTGLNVLTGETGAGKSIIIDALNLIMGDRIKSDFIRDSGKKAIAQAVFSLNDNPDAAAFLQENDLLEDDMAIISREIYPSGRSAARINGRNVPLSILKNLAGYLLDMHLQHENQNILKSDRYLGYIDSFSPHINEALDEVAALYQQLTGKQQELQNILTNHKQRLERIEFLSYQVKEIESAHLQVGEKEELIGLREKIQNASKLMEGSVRTLELLYSCDNASSAADLIFDALDIARGLDNYQPFTAMVSPLQDMYYTLQEIASQLNSFKDSLDFEPGLLEHIENRIYDIEKLEKRFGKNVAELIEYLRECKQELELLSIDGERQDELNQEIALLEKEYLLKARRLTGLRQEAGALLEKRVHDELQQLDMPHVKFMVKFTSRESPGKDGMDNVDFLFSPNPGEIMRPVVDIASGGEISRFILALKKALADVYSIPTLIFDEIDVGLGGNALNTVAAKLAELSSHHQVILVTHSPQVASYADNHYVIEKKVKGGQTFTMVKNLDREARVKELARMLAGDKYTQLTLEHAREMLKDRHNIHR
ncbi:MAG: DNA repair protein RecN [Syntrophomonadaceae bacterium]